MTEPDWSEEYEIVRAAPKDMIEPENACCNNTGRATGPCRNPGCTAVPESTATPREVETRYYIGLVNAGMRMFMKAGPAHFSSDPHAPVQIKDGGTWLYPVSGEVAREWVADDDEDDEL